MKKAVIALVLIFIILSQKFTYSHGFGTHAAHYSAILALNDEYRELIENPKFKPYFIYGSIFPDIQYAINYKTTLTQLYQKVENLWGVEGLTYEILLDQIPDVNVIPYPFGIDTHNDKYGMAFAEYLLQQCEPIDPPGPNPGSNGTTIAHDARNMKLAFALGYYAHLAQDVAAHDFLVPKLTVALNLGDIELIKNSQSFIQDPNSQTEGIIEGIIDHFYGDNNLIAGIIYWHVWANRSQFEPTITQMDFTTGYSHLLFDGPNPTYYDAQGGWPEMHPVLLFFNAVLNDWYFNNPFGLPSEYKEGNAPMSASGLNQLATVFRFVNRFYPAVAGHPFNNYDRLDQVLADWIGNHFDLEDGFELIDVLAEFFFNLVGNSFRHTFFEGFVYPNTLATTNEGLADDARSLVSLMLADMNEADLLVNSKPDLVNISEYNKLKNSILFTNPTSVLNNYWNEYRNLGTMVYNEVGPVEGEPSRWYYEWSPWHSNSMAWGALSSLNNLIPDIYATNPNVAVYDAYFEVNGNRITGPQLPEIFQNNPNVKVVVELYNTSNVSSESITLRVKKDHSSTNYSSDVLKTSTTFTIDHDPLTYNTTTRKKVELSFPVSLSDLSGYKGYYFELVNNSNNKVIFSSSFEQYQERLDLTPNYARLYGTYDEGKWPVSLGLIQSVATVNLTTPQFPEGGSGGSYKINGIPQSSIIGYVDDYINLEAIPPMGYVFYQWSDGNTENPRTYRIPSTSVNLYAKYKGTRLSSETNAYVNNSQRKFVRTPDGTLHNVYESMNSIWYEISTNGGSTWRIGNGGKPLAVDAKLPSIDFYGNSVGIVYQEYYGGYYKIKVKVFYGYPDYSSFGETTVFDEYVESYNENTNPVIAWGYNGRILIAWSGKADDLVWGYRDGLVVRNGYLSGTGGSTLYSTLVLPYTDDNSINPTITTDKNYQTPQYFSLAWEQVNSASSSDIKYYDLTIDGQNNVITRTTTPEIPSSGSGYSKNHKPTIVHRKLSTLPQNYIFLTWIGYRSAIADDGGGLNKGNAAPLYESRVLLRNRYLPSTSWSAFGVYGNNVQNLSSNRGTDYFYSIEAYAIAWSETNGSSNLNKFIRSSDSPAQIRTLSTTGKDLQLNNSVNFNNMFANSFQSNNLPYSFAVSQTLGSVNKENSLAIYNGREGVITKNGADFYFAVGDITLNGENINFIELPDSLIIENKSVLNSYLISEPFMVNSNSTLSYGVQYGITDSALASAAFSEGEFINFRVQLLDNNTGELLGQYDNITFNDGNTLVYNNISYDIDLTGIGNRTLILKLLVNTEGEFNYSLSDRYADEILLAKGNTVKLEYKGTLVVDSYDLAQNYPNPFNPITTIKYQIPKDGDVFLKIYDILGKEIKTLVNEHKLTGRYEINFDASNLASGVYIYKIQVNDYVYSKKMLLLK